MTENTSKLWAGVFSYSTFTKQSKMCHRLRVLAIVTISTLALFGCGGNSNTASTTQPTNTGDTAQSFNNGNANSPLPLILRSETPGVAPIQLDARSDELVLESNNSVGRQDYICDARRCVTPSGVANELSSIGTNYRRFSGHTLLDTKNGIEILRTEDRLNVVGRNDDRVRINSYSLWGKFGMGSTLYAIGDLATTSYISFRPVYWGYEAISNPVSGSATWSGAMAGVKVSNQSIGEEVIGDADMTADFISASVDLTFSDIISTSGTSSPDISWENVPMRRGVLTATGLEGGFYGFDHVEVGGIFQHSGIEGVFSLARDE